MHKSVKSRDNNNNNKIIEWFKLLALDRTCDTQSIDNPAT